MQNRFASAQASRLVAISLGLAVHVGCATESPHATPSSLRPLGAEYETFDAGDSRASMRPPSDAQSGPEVEGELTLRRSLGLALLTNPDLAAYSWETRVREAEALQAGLIPNPELTVEGENFAGDGAYKGSDRLETTIFLGQLVELGGKRAKRRRVAELERDIAGWDYEVKRLDVLTAVATAFVRVLEAQDRVALSNEILSIAESSLAAVSGQVRAGATSAVEQTRAEVSLSSAAVDRRSAEAELSTARSRLARTWGGQAARFERATGDLEVINAPPALDSLRDKVRQNPDIARWATELAHREALVALADARAIPNVTAGGGVRRLEEGNDTALVFGVTIPLPVFDRNQGSREARRHGVAKLRYEQRSAAVRVVSQLDIAHEELRSSYEEITALRARVLPQAERALDGVQAGYLRGLFRYVDVLDAQRTLFELSDQKLQALGNYHRTVATIERLIGAPLFGVDTAPMPLSSTGDER